MNIEAPTTNQPVVKKGDPEYDENYARNAYVMAASALALAAGGGYGIRSFRRHAAKRKHFADIVKKHGDGAVFTKTSQYINFKGASSMLNHSPEFQVSKEVVDTLRNMEKSASIPQEYKRTEDYNRVVDAVGVGDDKKEAAKFLLNAGVPAIAGGAAGILAGKSFVNKMVKHIYSRASKRAIGTKGTVLMSSLAGLGGGALPILGFGGGVALGTKNYFKNRGVQFDRKDKKGMYVSPEVYEKMKSMS